MNQTLSKVRDSPNAKLYLLIGFCVVATLLFLSSSSSSSEAADRLQSNRRTMIKTGGLGEVKQQDDRVKEVVEKIKPILEEKSGIKFDSIDTIHYKTQVVAGTNFFIKVKAKPVDGEEQIVHLRIYQDLKRDLELTAYQMGKALGDELEYFQ